MAPEPSHLRGPVRPERAQLVVGYTAAIVVALKLQPAGTANRIVELSLEFIAGCNVNRVSNLRTAVLSVALPEIFRRNRANGAAIGGGVRGAVHNDGSVELTEHAGRAAQWPTHRHVPMVMRHRARAHWLRVVDVVHAIVLYDDAGVSIAVRQRLIRLRTSAKSQRERAAGKPPTIRGHGQTTLARPGEFGNDVLSRRCFRETPRISSTGSSVGIEPCSGKLSRTAGAAKW